MYIYIHIYIYNISLKYHYIRMYTHIYIYIYISISISISIFISISISTSTSISISMSYTYIHTHVHCVMIRFTCFPAPAPQPLPCQGSTAGISARALALDAWSLCFRLSSTWGTRPFGPEPMKQLTVNRRMDGPVVGWSVGFLSSPGTLSSHSPIRLLKGAIKISWCKADSRLLDFLGVATLEILNHWSFWPGCGCTAICL